MNVSGKGKRGATVCGTHTPICRVVCANGASFIVTAAVPSRVLEVNRTLLRHPELIGREVREQERTEQREEKEGG